MSENVKANRQAGHATVNSLREVPGCSAVQGRVRWDPVHSVWNGGILVLAILLAPAFVSWSAILIFVLLTGASLLLGHSIGFHRLLIHRSFACPRWLERLLVWSGTLVGMSGPFWMIRTHDLRDWAQRQAACHDYLAHRRPMMVDAWWQLHCRLELDRPPVFDLGRARQDRFYRLLERTWMAQQVPLALLLYLAGGWPWVIWGICVRVSVCVTGHWFVGHLAHRRGPQSWLVKDAGVHTTGCVLDRNSSRARDRVEARSGAGIHGPVSARCNGGDEPLSPPPDAPPDRLRGHRRVEIPALAATSWWHQADISGGDRA